MSNSIKLPQGEKIWFSSTKNDDTSYTTYKVASIWVIGRTKVKKKKKLSSKKN